MNGNVKLNPIYNLYAEHLSLSMGKNSQLVITDKDHKDNVISSIGCKIIGSSWTDKIKEFFYTKFLRKWVKVDDFFSSDGKNVAAIFNKENLLVDFGEYFPENRLEDPTYLANELAEKILSNAEFRRERYEREFPDYTYTLLPESRPRFQQGDTQNIEEKK